MYCSDQRFLYRKCVVESLTWDHDMNGFMETFQDFKGCLNYITTVNYNLYCPYTDYLHSYFHIYIFIFVYTKWLPQVQDCDRCLSRATQRSYEVRYDISGVASQRENQAGFRNTFGVVYIRIEEIRFHVTSAVHRLWDITKRCIV